jgi:hypothetical protein
MKKVIRLTESDLGRIVKRVINENRVGLIKDLIKNHGMNYTIQAVGGFDNLRGVLNINSPIDFLHLFDNLEVVQSENDLFTLFRYGNGNNVMIYDKQYDSVYIDENDIWSFLKKDFNLEDSKFEKFKQNWSRSGLKDSRIKELTKEWLGNVYNLRGKSTEPKTFGDGHGSLRSMQ